MEVAKLQAAFELLDEASPAIESIEKSLDGLADAIGVTRQEMQKFRDEQAQMVKSTQLTEQAVEALGMSMKDYQKILANKKAMDDMHSEAIEINKTFKEQKTNIDMLSVAFGNMLANQVQNAASRFKNFVTESADLAVRLEMLVNVSRHLGETQGYTAKQIDDMAEAIRKQGITSIQSREAINKMVQAGLDLSKATKLARMAQDAGTIGNINSSEALGRLIHGITTMQTETLRTVGVVVNMEQAQKAYAKELGKTKDALTGAEKQQAAMNAVLAQGEKIMGSYETRMGTAGGQMLSLQRIQEEAMIKIGESLKPIKELEVQMSTAFWKKVQEYPEVFIALGSALTIAATGLTIAGFAATTFGIGVGAAATAAAAWVVAAGPVIITLAAITAALYVGVEAWKTYEAVSEAAGKLDAANAGFIAQAQAIANLHPEWGFLAAEIDTVNEAQLVYQKNQAETTKRATEGAAAAEKLAEANRKAADAFFANVNKGAGVTQAAMDQAAVERVEKQLAAERKLAEAEEKREKARKLLKREKGVTVTDEEAAIVLRAEENYKKLEKAQKAAATAAETHAKKIAALNEQFTGNKAQEEADMIAQALRDVDSAAEVKNLDALGDKLRKLADDGAKLTPQLMKLYEASRLLAAQKILADPKNKLDLKTDLAMSKGTKGGLVQDLSPKALGFKGQADFSKMAVEMAKLGIPLGDIKTKLEGVGAQFYEVDKAMKVAEVESLKLAKVQADSAKKTAMWAQAFQGLIGIMGLFGGEAAAVAQIASNSFNQFASAGAHMKSAQQQMAAAKTETEKFAAAQEIAAAKGEKFNAVVNAAADAAGLLGGILDKSTNPTVQKLGGALQGAAAGAKLGAAFGPWGAAIGAVGGAILGFIGKAKKMRAEMEKLKKEFIESHGGMEKLSKEAKQAGIDIDKAFKAKTPEQLKKQLEAVNKQLDAFNELLDMTGGTLESLKGAAADAGISLQEIWDAKTPEEYLAAVEKVKAGLNDWNTANDKLNAAMDKYGISVDQLGGRFKQAGMDKIGLGMLESFELLKAAGADVGLITEKMSEDMSDYVNKAVAAGATIPAAMKPMVEEMIKNGDLLDENGEAYDSLTDAGITFAQTLEEGVASAVAAIQELVAVLAQGFNVPVNVHAGSGGGGNGGGGGEPPPNQEGFAGGSGGFRDFGRGTSVTLHGREAVVTPDGLKDAIAELMGMHPNAMSAGPVSSVVNLSINENPMQTAETVEQMRAFTLETVEKEVARSLADAIANGRA